MAKNAEISSSYRLSDASIKSSREFGYATRAASSLKKAFLPLVFDKYGNLLHKRLQRCIIAVLSTGQAAKKGERTLADGNVGLLNGLELNPYANFSSLTSSVYTDVEVCPAPRSVKIQLPSVGTDDFAWPDRSAVAYLNVRCVVLDVHKLTFDAYALESLSFSRGSPRQPSRTATVVTGDMEDCLVSVAISVSFLRTDSGGYDGVISHNRRYYAARVVEAAYVKDGRVVEYEGNAEPRKTPPKTAPDGAHTIKWDEA